jgi:hypothetical protein
MAAIATARPTRRPRARLPSDRAAERLAASDLDPSPAASPISHHDDAVGRLEEALAEQRRTRHQYETASGTPLE